VDNSSLYSTTTKRVKRHHHMRETAVDVTSLEDNYFECDCRSSLENQLNDLRMRRLLETKEMEIYELQETIIKLEKVLSRQSSSGNYASSSLSNCSSNHNGSNSSLYSRADSQVGLCNKLSTSGEHESMRHARSSSSCDSPVQATISADSDNRIDNSINEVASNKSIVSESSSFITSTRSMSLSRVPENILKEFVARLQNAVSETCSNSWLFVGASRSTIFEADSGSQSESLCASVEEPISDADSCGPASGPLLTYSLQTLLLHQINKVIRSGAFSLMDALNKPFVSDRDRCKCMNCFQNFTVLRRRHHCRVCKEVFCGSCAGKKLILPSVEDDPKGSKPSEKLVCDSCFSFLSFLNHSGATSNM
jgi:hypothetical protein